MAGNTRTLKLILDLVAKGSYKAQATELKETARAAGDAQKALSSLGNAGGSKASGDFKALGATVREAVGEVTKFRAAQDAAADTAIRVAKASGDYGRALALVKTELGLAEAGSSRYNAKLIESTTLQARLRAEAEKTAAAQARAAQQAVAAQERVTAAQQRAVQQELAAANQRRAGRSEWKDIDQTKAASDGLLGSLKGLAAGYIGLQGAQMALDWAKQGAAMQGVEQSFQRLAETSGRSSQTMLNELRKASQGMVSDAALMEGANKAMLLGGERLASALPKILQIAQASARATGQDMQYVFDSLVTGLARGSKEIIDNAGITVSIAQANEVYAASIGKTVLQLTDQEKALAFQNEVLRQGEGFINRLGGAAEGNAGKVAQAAAAWDNFWNSVKGGAANVLVATIDTVSLAGQGLAGFASKMQEVNTIALQGGASYQAYIDQLRAVGEASNALTPAQYAAAQSMVAAGVNAQTAATSVAALGSISAQVAGTFGTMQAEFQDAGNAAYFAVEAQDALAQKATELAARMNDGGVAVQDLTQQFADGAIPTAMEYEAALDQLASVTFDVQEATYANAEATAYGTEQTVIATAATYEQIFANEEGAFTLYEQANASVEASIAQQALAFETDQAGAATAAAIGSYFASGGALDALSLKALNAAGALAAVRLAQEQIGSLQGGPGAMPPEVYKPLVASYAKKAADPSGWAREYARVSSDMNRAASERERATEKAQREAAKAAKGGGASKAKGAGSKAKELDPAKEAADAARMAGETAQSLAKLRGYVAPAQADIDAYTGSLAAMTASFGKRTGEVAKYLTEDSAKFADQAKNIVGMLKTGVDGFNALRGYTSVPREAMDAFTGDLAEITRQFGERSKEVNLELAADTMLFAKTASEAVGTIKEGVEAFAALKGYSGTAQIEIALFSLALRDTFKEFSERTKEIDLTLAEGTNTFSESSKKAVDTIAGGIAAFKALEGFAGVAFVDIALFSLAMRDVYREFSERTKEIDLGLAEATNTFSDSAKRSIDTIASGIEAFAKLQDYAGVPQDKINLIGQDIRQTVALMTAMAQQFEAEGVAAAATFADSVGRIVAPIGAAVDAFAKLEEYKGVAPAAMGLVFVDMRASVTMMQQTSAMMDAEGVAAAAVFAGHASTMFSAISGGADALGSIRDYESVAPEAFGAFAGDFMRAVDMTSQLAGASGVMLEQSNVWRSNIDSAVANIKGGIDSLASLNGLSVNLQASVSASGSSGAGGAPAAGGGGGIFAGLPGRALGGPVNAGQAYMVGERGREVFVPDRAGTIVPNHALGGDQAVIVQGVPGMIQITIQGGDQVQTRATVLSALSEWEKQQAAAARAASRGKRS